MANTAAAGRNALYIIKRTPGISTANKMICSTAEIIIARLEKRRFCSVAFDTLGSQKRCSPVTRRLSSQQDARLPLAASLNTTILRRAV